MLRKIKWLITKVLFKNNREKYIKGQFEYVMGKKLNLKSPKSYNEKLNWIKIFYYNPLYEKCSDKIDVREYIEQKGYSENLTKLYGIYNSFDEIDFEELPNKFVIKASNGSGGVVAVKDKNKLDKNHAKCVINAALKDELYNMHGEWQYKNLKKRILVEELIESDNKYGILDYKIFCFNGKAHYIYVSTTKANGKDGNELIDFYDREWKHLDVRRYGHKNMGYIPKPKNYSKMISIAENLSKDFIHVRVDLYNENGRIYFGELTFTTGAGYGKFDPESFDEEMGQKFDIEGIKNNER